MPRTSGRCSRAEPARPAPPQQQGGAGDEREQNERAQQREEPLARDPGPDHGDADAEVDAGPDQRAQNERRQVVQQGHAQEPRRQVHRRLQADCEERGGDGRRAEPGYHLLAAAEQRSLQEVRTAARAPCPTPEPADRVGPAGAAEHDDHEHDVGGGEQGQVRGHRAILASPRRQDPGRKPLSGGPWVI
jgi:hypothetical protein